MKRVDIKVGFLCNNNCRFCVQAHNRLKGNRPIEDIKKDLENARGDCGGVVFTGGEVTIRKDFFDLVRYAKELDYKIIQIQTNSRMLASMEFCKETIKSGATEFSPALHGYCKEQHDFLTQSPGSFEQTVKSIINLKRLGCKVITNTVVVKPNYRDIPKIAKLLVKLDVDQFQFAFVHALGNAMKNFDAMVPRISMAAPFIHKGLQIGLDAGKKVMAEAMPYCLMKGYYDYIAERVIPDTVIRGTKEQNTDDYTEQRIVRGKTKFDKCKFCIHYSYCEGPWKEYPEKFGDSEFVPIGPKYMNFRRYIELRSVMEGIKQVHRDYIEEQYKEEFERYIRRLGLEILFADESFTEKRGLIRPSSEGNIMYYTSKNIGLCEEMKELEKNINDDNFMRNTKRKAELLGYPECCVDFFVKNHSLESPLIFIESFSSTKENPKAELNIIDGSRRIVSHIPCSANCGKSIEQVKKIMDLFDLKREDLIGYYLFFKNGYYFSLKKIKKDVFSVIGSGSNFNGSLEDINTLENFSSKLNESDHMRITDSIHLYKKNKLLCNIEGKNKDWIFVEYE